MIGMTTRRDLTLTGPAQLKAMGDRTRTSILELLDDEPQSAKRLAERLGMTHGKVGHHLGVLERAGLVEVVARRPARGFVEKIYAPTFDRLHFAVQGAEHDRLRFLFQQAAAVAAPAASQPFEPLGRLLTVRMSVERAQQFAERLVALADEFGASAEEGERFAIAGAVYRVETPEDGRG